MFVHSFVFIRSFVSSFICRFSLLIYLSVTSRDRLPWNVSLLYDISVHPEQNQFPENDESSKSEFISSSWSISNREWKIQNVYDGIHVLGLDLQAMTMTMLFAKQLFPFLYVHLINQTQYSIKHRTQTNLVTQVNPTCLRNLSRLQ